MQGIVDYLKKHGYHFTEELAKDAVPHRWSMDTILKEAQRRVYYNVSGSTLGDIYYLVNWIPSHLDHPKANNLRKGITGVLSVVGTYGSNGFAFCLWLDEMKKNNKDFDFTPYI